MFCSRCQSELPEQAKFCANCGLKQSKTVHVARSYARKGQPIGKLDTEQTQIIPPLIDHSTALPTTPATPITLLSGNETTVPYTPVSLSPKSCFIQNTKPHYIGRVVTRKSFRRNLLLTRTGLSVLLIVLTCILIRVGFAILYALLHHRP